MASTQRVTGGSCKEGDGLHFSQGNSPRFSAGDKTKLPESVPSYTYTLACFSKLHDKLVCLCTHTPEKKREARPLTEVPLRRAQRLGVGWPGVWALLCVMKNNRRIPQPEP